MFESLLSTWLKFLVYKRNQSYKLFVNQTKQKTETTNMSSELLSHTKDIWVEFTVHWNPDHVPKCDSSFSLNDGNKSKERKRKKKKARKKEGEKEEEEERLRSKSCV